MTDTVIDRAVGRLPPEYRARNAGWLAHALKLRRDALPAAAARFYRLLAGEVEIHGTDQPDRAEVTVERGRTLDVTLYSRQGDTSTPHFHRRFDRADTREVRLFLHGGNDAVRVHGAGSGAPVLRVIGGGGDDQVTDSSRAGGTRFYDARGANRADGTQRPPLDPRPFPDFRLSDSTPYPERDWGGFWRFRPWLSSAPDVGLFIGGGVVRYNFGFRTRPYRSRVAVRAGYATGAERFRAEVVGEFRRLNSRVRTTLLLRASGIEVVRFFGFGNDTRRVAEDAFYRVRQEQYEVAPAIVVPVGARGALTVGPMLKYASTDADPSRFIGQLRPYGSGPFGQVGAAAGVEWDTRDGRAASRGLHLSAGGSLTPPIWDVVRTFGELHAEAATYLTPRTSFGPTLALRAGGKKVWGDFPFFESAFVGGASNVRGLREQRYAGDAALYGSAELRARLGRFYVVLPGDYGVFGLVDAGRVFLEGATSDTWHTGVGGGIWFAVLEPGNTITLSLVRGDDRTAFYLRAGFAY